MNSCPSFWISLPLDSEQKPQTKQWCQLSKTVTWQSLPPVRNIGKKHGKWKEYILSCGNRICLYAKKKPSQRNLPRTTYPFWWWSRTPGNHGSTVPKTPTEMLWRNICQQHPALRTPYVGRIPWSLKLSWFSIFPFRLPHAWQQHPKEDCYAIKPSPTQSTSLTPRKRKMQTTQ